MHFPGKGKVAGLPCGFQTFVCLCVAFVSQFALCVIAAIAFASKNQSLSDSAWYLDNTWSPGVSNFVSSLGVVSLSLLLPTASSQACLSRGVFGDGSCGRRGSAGCAFSSQAFGRFVLLLSYFVPITLLVQLEVCRWAQAGFLSADERMRGKGGLCATAQSMALMDELGAVTHVFTDKTGTLTQNLMQFRCMAVGGEIFGYDEFEEEVRRSALVSQETQGLAPSRRMRRLVKTRSFRRCQPLRLRRAVVGFVCRSPSSVQTAFRAECGACRLGTRRSPR